MIWCFRPEPFHSCIDSSLIKLLFSYWEIHRWLLFSLVKNLYLQISMTFTMFWGISSFGKSCNRNTFMLIWMFTVIWSLVQTAKPSPWRKKKQNLGNAPGDSGKKQLLGKQNKTKTFKFFYGPLMKNIGRHRREWMYLGISKIIWVEQKVTLL